MLCQMCYLMLTISMALVRLLAAGLTAAADVVDANIVDIPEPEVAPATLECTSADVADKKGQRVLAAAERAAGGVLGSQKRQLPRYPKDPLPLR